MLNNFEFLYHMDSMGFDMVNVGRNKTLDELMILCKSYKKCIAFNTLGFLKFNLTDKQHFRELDTYTEEHDGLYIHKKRYNKLIQKVMHKSYINFDDYIFYRNKDSPDHDINFVRTKSLEELKTLADNDPKCAGFNTLGFLKSYIRPEKEFIDLLKGTPTEGMYVKKTNFRVKLMCNWTSSYDLCMDWNRMSKGNFRWNDIEITWEDKNVDFYVIINKPGQSDFYKPERTIIFHMEPWCGDSQQNWGVKTWGIWAEPDEEKFLQVRSHKNYYNNGFWQLAATYSDLKTMVINKTGLMSSICSSKYFDPGHIKRIDFLKFCESKNDDVVKIDVYNTDNIHNFKNYKGPHPHGYKDAGILPYKYYFMPENNIEENFITEKIWEPLLTETLTFYWGCPNIAEYIDPRAFIVLDLDDFEKAFNTVKTAIMNNEWEKRIEIIRREKQKVLDYYQFFPTLERVLHNQFKFNRKPSDSDIQYHKTFHKTIGNEIKNTIFINNISDNINQLTKIINSIINSNLINKVDYVYVINYGKKIDYEMNNILTSKINVINYSKNMESSNKKTFELVKLFSQYNKDCNLLYINGAEDIFDPVLYFLITNNTLCMDLLNIYSAVGCNGVEMQDELNDAWWANTNNINNDINKLSLDCNKYVLHTISDVFDVDKSNNMIESFYEFNSKTRIKCVNLERRPDRKALMTSTLEKLDLMKYCDMFSAVDGQKLQPTLELEKLFKDNDFHSKRGVIGCALSHYQLWQQLMLDPTYDNYLVLEDDITIDGNIKFKLNQLYRKLPSDWDIVYLGFHMYKKNKQQYNQKISKLDKITVIPYDTTLTIGGTFGYLVNKSGASKFVEFIKKNGIKHGVDYMMFKYEEAMNLKQYETVPSLVFSEFVESGMAVDSDIQYDGSRLF